MKDKKKATKKNAENKNNDAAGHWVRVKQYINRWKQLMESAKYGYNHRTFFIPCRDNRSRIFQAFFTPVQNLNQCGFPTSSFPFKFQDHKYDTKRI